MEYQHWTIKEAIKRIGEKKLYLPAIQRKFVWDALQIEQLFDSIMRDYPIGTFLFWMVEQAKQNDYSFYEFIRDFHARDNCNNTLAAKPHLPNELIGVLDGQQRLNSMFVALQGTYAYKRPRVWASSPNAFPVRRFFINVFKPERELEGDDCIYEFRFLTQDEAKASTPESCWCLVKDLLECNGIPDVNRYWAARKRALPSEIVVADATDDRALNILGRLWERLTTIPIINYFPVNNQNLDEVLDIFVRVNSAGTPLAKTDLLFSTIVAQWENGRDAIEEFLSDINDKGNGFYFDTDFIMRAALVLSDRQVRLSVASFKSDNVKRIVKDWSVITGAIDRAVDLLVEWGFEGKSLTSVNAVIPIAYAIKQGCDLKTSKADLRLLLVKSLLTGVYGSSGDQVLASMRRAVADTVKPGGSFDIAAFEKTSKLPGGRSISINEEVLDELLESTKGGRTFALLSLLSPHLRFSQVQFHQDHIHPHAGFSVSALRKLKLTDQQIDEWREMRDALPNLQLLEGRENQIKSKTTFRDWLQRQVPNISEARAYLRTQNIPVAVSLDLENFENFYEKRRVLLKQKLAKMLNVRVT
jgi:hypothetical protein